MILPVAFLHEEIKGQAVQVNAVNAFNYSGKATHFFVNGKENLWRNKPKATWVMQEQDHGKSVPEYARQ